MYTVQGAPDKEDLVRQHAQLVKRLAFQLMAKLPASVQADDLIQNGMIGLLDALDRFEEGMGAQFETYAAQRIRGAMLDGLREDDWVPRGVRREMRRVEEAIHKLEHEHGRPPSEGELAAALGMELGEYQKLLQGARGHQLIYLEDLVGERDESYLDRNCAGPELDDPLALLEDIDSRRALASGIEALPEREKTVMALYYDDELNLKEIGEVLGVTESRVCQLHSQAVARLRVAMRLREGAPVETKRRGRPPKSSQVG
ncbi:MAG: RNA polymerase sigma factor FliA [Gammaproteobacteria bacterium]|nr:RNA polymerase sigma factor FliA [Gammaproteobacteria bacterium]MBU1415422.1 RNA polymerase sigma factor FliA [Gammaproteobacteria bacterium]